MVRVQVPATTANLGPGFDCLGAALNLYNTVELSAIPSGLSIEVEGEGKNDIPRDENNTVYRAVQEVFRLVGYRPPGISIKLVNNIPVARGLGSSSAAIVGGITAANIISGGTMSEKDILDLAIKMEGHPDNVAASVMGGIVVSIPTDGGTSCLRIAAPQNLRVIVAIPDFKLATGESRKVLPQQAPMKDVIFNLSRVALLVSALFTNDFNRLGMAMEDRLHQPYRADLVPGMKEVFAAARSAGARGIALSGSGPAIIAFADENVDHIAGVILETFRQSGVSAVSMVLNLSPTGAGAI